MIKVNQDQCIGCGVCVSICPEVFEIDNNAKAKVIKQTTSFCVKEAIKMCPVKAISKLGAE